jgi:hypothetical protein
MRYLLSLAIVLGASSVFAADLTIHAAEIGVGKFHRHDNKVHPYESSNAWKPYILPDNAPAATPIVVENADHSVSIFFSTLEELLSKIEEIATERKDKVTVLNLNGHGMPGAMWFPHSKEMEKSIECWQWKASAAGTDEKNYNQYYSPVSKEDVMRMRAFSQTGGKVGCTTGPKQWKWVVEKMPNLKNVLAKNMRVNFLSCVVGLGPVGEKASNDIAALLFGGADGSQASVQSTLYFGLGDWSMGEGMGFWDYQNDEQLKKDTEIYPLTKRDRDIMQKGPIRMTSFGTDGWISKVYEGKEFMKLDGEGVRGSVISEPVFNGPLARPTHIRIPGTAVIAEVH